MSMREHRKDITGSAVERDFIPFIQPLVDTSVNDSEDCAFLAFRDYITLLIGRITKRGIVFGDFNVGLRCSKRRYRESADEGAKDQENRNNAFHSNKPPKHSDCRE